ncbi:MAG: site-2 protease family protein [Armatimonadetes bacterium]|nr:site-2 protease family protein [Armatimonadota bacterium]
MPEDPTRLVVKLIITLPIFMFSLTVHEFAHGWMARRFGDHTAEDAGRLTLDPRAHIDPFGLLLFIFASLTGFGFGWAKPVPVNLGNCRNPLRAMFWVAAAGPLSNLLQAALAVLVLLVLKLAGVGMLSVAMLGNAGLLVLGEPLGVGLTIGALASYYLIINLALMLFNLIPLPPLDGGRIAVSLLPYRFAKPLAQLEQYGFIILIVLLQVGVTKVLVGAPLVYVITHLAKALG